MRPPSGSVDNAGSRKVEPHETPTPGPRSEITLRLGAASLPQLLAGVNVERMWLTEEDELGVYGLHATRTLGESRKDDPVKPAVDVLVGLLNEFVEVLNEHEDVVPKPIGDAWDQLMKRWNDYPRTGA